MAPNDRYSRGASRQPWRGGPWSPARPSDSQGPSVSDEGFLTGLSRVGGAQGRGSERTVQSGERQVHCGLGVSSSARPAGRARAPLAHSPLCPEKDDQPGCFRGLRADQGA